MGAVDHLQINEASGVAASGKYPDRLYHVNDSGGGSYFYISNMKGKGAKAVKINGYETRQSDFESIDAGNCFSGKSCIFVADIGDNRKRRDFVEIVIIEEMENYKGAADPLARVKIAYPDGPHNAEALGVHPNGDIYILTKEEDLNSSKAFPSRVYRLAKEKWENPGPGVNVLDYLGDIDLPGIIASDSPFAEVVTSFDIAPDGKRFIVLTYENAIEFGIDLSQKSLRPASEMVKGKDYNIVEIIPLPQQESITYLDGGKSFLYDSEYHLFEVPIIRVDCIDGN